MVVTSIRATTRDNMVVTVSLGSICMDIYKGHNKGQYGTSDSITRLCLGMCCIM